MVILIWPRKNWRKPTRCFNKGKQVWYKCIYSDS